MSTSTDPRRASGSAGSPGSSDDAATPASVSASVPTEAGMLQEGGVAVSDDVSDAVAIADTPPQRVHDFSDLVNAALTVAVAVVIMLSAVYLRGISTGVEADVHHAGLLFGWLVELPLSMLQQIVAVLIVVAVLGQLILGREWVQSVTATVSMFLGFAMAGVASWAIGSFGADVLVQALDSRGVIGGALLPDIFAGLSAFLTAAGPHRVRGSVKWGWNTLIAIAALFMIISVDPIAGVAVAFAIGRLIGLLIRFALGTQNKGVWGRQMVQALAGIGLDVIELRRCDPNLAEIGRLSLADDLSPFSRIYDVRVRTGERYVISVCDEQTRTVGYLSQLWLWLRMASGVDLRRDRSMSEATHHHVDLLLTLRNIGLETPSVYARTESGESSIMVFHADPSFTPCDWNTVKDDDLVEVMDYLAAANRRGVTHRNITPESFARSGTGRMVLAGWLNGDDASSPANVAIDRVQMLAALSCRVGIGRVIRCAERSWGRDALTGLVPFVQNVAVSRTTRTDEFWSRETLKSLRHALEEFSPDEESGAIESVTLSRFNVKSFVTLVLLIVAAVVVFTQLKPQDFLNAVSQANPWMAALSFLFGVASWIGSAVALGAFIDPDRRSTSGILASQAAGSFTTVSMPAGVGPAFVNLQYLRRIGYRNAKATAIMSAVLAVQAITIAGLLVVIGIFTGRNTLSGMIPTNTLVIAIGLTAFAMSAAMIVPFTRRMIIDRLVPIVLSYARQLVELLSQPRKLFAAMGGWLLQNLLLGLSFWAALMALGQHANPLEITFIYVLTNTLASAVPTPGGLGAIEAALTLGFTSVGIPYAVALSATLLFRLLTYWLRIPIGAAAMKWMNVHGLL
ncbi:YbhN family protein [Bifidobacterium tissieri]|uniref:lysylphosphatidylglycerol synthase transmembrane domain-containing protein n=1 Tax=Bifidobacterium tissieri TaxID=1630162 RepID=UPI001CC2BF25|nr:lysylphosphatidylglycerol synthase transmembrane domain-containing protein [Bifidobacterium tissieri]